VDLDELWERDRKTCALCGKYVKFKDATRDHRIPKSKGGPGTDDNIQLAHWRCNQKKSDS
jgi:5-methylcytosine-specific restriction endonuclease McrA